MQTVLECKQCGGKLQSTGERIVYCEYCGSANVFTFVDRFALYNQANYLRQKNEFDRAINVYENILNEDPNDAEGYFGIALCKYGIEYVDEPNSERKLPTCHRTRIKLFSQDEDYLKAVSLSEPDVAEVYRREAESIDHILKRIQQLSFNQKKYDVFICYKESDENGDRTQTSVIAQDIYEQLNKRGYRVFFARKTLAGMIGSDYEPIIFSALYSAKVMLVIGSRTEEFQGIWVRNEWVRFMERISGGDECTLIPCYKGMSPYDLPPEMVNIQSLDISKIGFMQDITDALERLIKRDKEVKIVETSGGNADSLKRRAYLFLEEGDFNQASQYFEKALDIDPEDSDCYWGKLLVSLKCQEENRLENLFTPISEDKNYRMALRFSNEEQAARYRRYSDIIDKNAAEEKQKKDEEEKLAAEEAERLKKAEEEKTRLAREEAEKKKRLEKIKKKRVRIRIVGTLIATPIIIIIYICVLDPIGTRAMSCYTTYIKDNPAAAKSIMDSYYGFDTAGNYKVISLAGVRSLLFVIPDNILHAIDSGVRNDIYEKIDEIDKFCIGYPKVENFYRTYGNKESAVTDNRSSIELYSFSGSRSLWMLSVNDGVIDCKFNGFYQGADFGINSDEALLRYKIDKSLIRACEKHSDIEKFYVSFDNSGEYGVLFLIDSKQNVFAEPFGYKRIYSGIYGHDEEVSYYGIDAVKKLKDIEYLKMGSDNDPYLYALKSNGEIIKLMITSDEENKDKAGIIDTDYKESDWEDIQTILIYPNSDIYYNN